MVKLLLESGVDINAKNNVGETPLHHAAEFGNSKIADFLIKAGTDINVRDNEGRTPLYYIPNKH